jgi:hypothetical protein
VLKLTIPSHGKRIKKPYEVLPHPDNKAVGGIYYSERFDKWIVVPHGRKSDGATFAIDIHSAGWVFHDEVCESGVWHDGTICTNWQRSWVLQDILDQDGYDIRRWYWFWLTFLFGVFKKYWKRI